MRFRIRSPAQIFKSAFLLIAGISLLTLIDIVAVKMIIRTFTETYGLPWTDFETTILGHKMLVWHLGFIPMAMGIFILLSIAQGNWRLGVTGNLLFAAGLEDMLYYFFQPAPLPAELPWLNHSLGIGWTRILTQSAHVTAIGLIIAVALAIIMSGLLIMFEKRKSLR